MDDTTIPAPAPPAPATPAGGGSYLLNEETGELTLIERTSPQGASRETTEPELLFLNERNAS